MTKKTSAIREQHQQIRQKILAAEEPRLPPARAVDLMALMSRAADLFTQQAESEQRKLLMLVLKCASWRGGELQMSLREPFEQLRLSNSAK